MTNGSRTFIRITNKDIYDKLMGIENVLQQQDSRIAFSKKIALLSLSLTISMILIVFAWAN